MREYIINRLNEMRSAEEKAILREVMNSVFLPLYDATEQKYSALEERVRDELPLIYDKFAIYNTVLPREQVNSKHTWLFPMCAEDVGEPEDSADTQKATKSKNRQQVIERVFCEADYLIYRQIDREKKTMEGALKVGSDRLPFKFHLKQTTKYSKIIQSLHGAFVRNDVPWATVNSTYMNKFFDICLDESSEIPLDAEFLPENTEMNFGTYTGIIHRQHVPVWNITRHPIRNDIFPIPAADTESFVYRFDLTTLGSEDGYLVDYENPYILDIRREGHILVLTSSKREGLHWDMHRLCQKQDSDTDVYPYPVLSNARKDSFSERLMHRYSSRIGTKAEMRKLLTSFKVSEYVALSDLQFTGEKIKGDSYDMNHFIMDEIRVPAFQKTLVLSFRAKKLDTFFIRDIISFLVSEVQTVYPQYRCVGILL